MKWNKGPTKKLLRIKVTSHESELEFNISPKSTGKYLFDLVCSTIGLRETWYFGLQSYSVLPNGRMRLSQWLKLDKKIVSQRASAVQKQLCFFFHTKFFPEDIEQELIQATTRHLFYLSVKATILNRNETDFNGTFSGDLCPSLDVAIILASLAAQAEYGDLCEDELDDKDDPNFLPTRLLRLIPAQLVTHVQSNQMLAQKLRECYKSYKGINRDKAELQYLKLAQMHHLFGVDFFPIVCVRMKCPRALSLARYLTRNELAAWHGWDKHHTNAWLGVTAAGIQLYGKNRRERPRYTFQWNIIKNVSYRERKFTVKLIAGWRFPHKSSHTPANAGTSSIPAEGHQSGSRPVQPSSRSTGGGGGRSPLIGAGGPTLTVGFGAGGSNISAASLPSTPLSARLALPASSPMGTSGLGSPSNLTASPRTQRDFSYERAARRCGQSPITMKSSGRTLDFESGCIPGLTPISTGCSTNELPIIGGVGCLTTPRIQTTDSSGAASSSLSSSKSSFTPLHQHHQRASNEPLINVVEVWLADPTQAKTVMTMCAGNHALFMRRRQPDSVEVQQMRAQAREERARREIERSRLARARAEKAEAIDAKQALETRCAQLEQALLHQQELQRAFISGGLAGAAHEHRGSRVKSQPETDPDEVERGTLELRTPQPPHISRRSLRLTSASGDPRALSSPSDAERYAMVHSNKLLRGDERSAEVGGPNGEQKSGDEVDGDDDEEEEDEEDGLDHPPGSSDIQFGDCVFYPPENDDVDELDYSEYVRWAAAAAGGGGVCAQEEPPCPFSYPATAASTPYRSRHFTQQHAFHASGLYPSCGRAGGGSASTPATPFVRRAMVSGEDSGLGQPNRMTPQMSRRRLTVAATYPMEHTDTTAGTPRVPYSAHFSDHLSSHPPYHHSSMWTPCVPDQSQSHLNSIYLRNDPCFAWEPSGEKRNYPFATPHRFARLDCPTTVGSMPALHHDPSLAPDANLHPAEDSWGYPVRLGGLISTGRHPSSQLPCPSYYACGPTDPSGLAFPADYCPDNQRRIVGPQFDTAERWCSQPGVIVPPLPFGASNAAGGPTVARTCGQLSTSLSAILSPVVGARWQHMQASKQSRVTAMDPVSVGSGPHYPHLSRHMSYRSVPPVFPAAPPMTRSTSQIFPGSESYPFNYPPLLSCPVPKPSLHPCHRPNATASRRQSLQHLAEPSAMGENLSPMEYIPAHMGYYCAAPMRRAASIGESAWIGDPSLAYTSAHRVPQFPFPDALTSTTELPYHSGSQLNPAQRGYLSCRLQEERARFAMLQAQFSKQLSDTWACLQVTRSPGGIKPPDLYGSPMHNTSLNNELRLDPAGASDGASTGGAGGGGAGQGSGGTAGTYHVGLDQLCGPGMHQPVFGAAPCDRSESTAEDLSTDGLLRGSGPYAEQNRLDLNSYPPSSGPPVCDRHSSAVSHYGPAWCPEMSNTSGLDGTHLRHLCAYCLPGNALVQPNPTLIE